MREDLQLAHVVHLAAHVHCCSTKNQVVLLDLKRNKYLGLSGADANALARRVVDLPKCDEASRPLDDSAVAGLFQEMSNAGMLSRSGEHGASYPSVAVAAPTAALIDGYSDVSIHIGARDLACFATAALSAKLLLRRVSLERIARRIRARRLRRRSDGPPDIDRLQSLVAGFAKMRTFAFTASNECLFDSLALSEFLSLYRIFPDWVFGVTTNPFAAHCWLQQDAVVINDSPEHVRRFTPIMSI
jgi:hypothetical protein